MKARRGSALVLVLCVTGALSVLLLCIYQRASLLLQTVVEREQDIKLRCAAEALMLYAVYMAKHNWIYLLKDTAQGNNSEHRFVWEIDEAKKAAAGCLYKAAGKECLGIEVILEPDIGRAIKISCELRKGKSEKVVINAWREGL